MTVTGVACDCEPRWQVIELAGRVTLALVDDCNSDCDSDCNSDCNCFECVAGSGADCD